MLTHGERPLGEPLIDPARSENPKRGMSASRLVAAGWFNSKDDDSDERPIQVCLTALSIPGENKISAVVAIHADLSEQVKANDLIKAIMLVLMSASLSSLSLYLPRGLKRALHRQESRLR